MRPEQTLPPCRTSACGAPHFIPFRRTGCRQVTATILLSFLPAFVPRCLAKSHCTQPVGTERAHSGGGGEMTAEERQLSRQQSSSQDDSAAQQACPQFLDGWSSRILSVASETLAYCILLRPPPSMPAGCPGSPAHMRPLHSLPSPCLAAAVSGHYTNLRLGAVQHEKTRRPGRSERRKSTNEAREGMGGRWPPVRVRAPGGGLV